MKKKKKKIMGKLKSSVLALILALAMIISNVCIAFGSQDESQSENQIGANEDSNVGNNVEVSGLGLEEGVEKSSEESSGEGGAKLNDGAVGQGSVEGESKANGGAAEGSPEEVSEKAGDETTEGNPGEGTEKAGDETTEGNPGDGSEKVVDETTEGNPGESSEEVVDETTDGNSEGDSEKAVEDDVDGEEAGEKNDEETAVTDGEGIENPAGEGLVPGEGIENPAGEGLAPGEGIEDPAGEGLVPVEGAGLPGLVPVEVQLENRAVSPTVYTDSTLGDIEYDGAIITLSGEMPADAYAVAYPVDLVLEGKEEVLAAYDITLYYGDGQVYELTSSIIVNIQKPNLTELLENTNMDEVQINLLHIPDGSSVEEATVLENTAVTVTEQAIIFEVEHFSIYAVTITYNESSLILSYSENGIEKSIEVQGTQNDYNASISVYEGSKLSFDGGTYTSGSANHTVTIIEGGEIAEVTSEIMHLVKFTRDSAQSNSIVSTLTLSITPVPAPEVEIEDTIITDGRLVAVVSGVDENTEVKYRWEKSNSPDGNYVEVKSNTALSSDGKSVNVADDSGGRAYYRVTATFGEEQAITSQPFFVKYYMELQNGGFENPKYQGSLIQISNQTALESGVVWQTTGVGTGGKVGADLEIINVGTEENKKNFQKSYYRGLPHLESIEAIAADGVQFAEINCESYGVLYQDVLVVPGSMFYWQVAHRGRYGTDKMAVVIMPTNDTNDVVIATPDDYKKVEKDAQIAYDVDGKYIGKIIEDGNERWKYYHGDGYTVPEDVYVVRFFFMSMESAGNDVSLGNFVDDITFSAERPLTYKIKYYVNGKEADYEEGGAFSGSVINATKTDKYKDYALQSTKLDNTDNSGSTSFNLTMEGSLLEIYYITNAVSVTKTFEGVLAEDIGKLYGYEVKFELCWYNIPVATATIIFDGKSTSKSAVFKDNRGREYKLSGLTATYYIKEKKTSLSEITGYTFEGVACGIDKMSPGNELSFTTTTTLTPSKGYNAHFTNTYKPKQVDVTVKKVDDADNPLKGAAFKLYYLDKNSQLTAVSEDTNKSYTSDENGCIAITGLTPGVTIYALEEIAAPEGYVKLGGKVYFKVNSEGVTLTDVSGTALEGNKTKDNVIGEGFSIKVPNTKEVEVYTLPDTGGAGTKIFRVAGAAILVCALGGAVFIYRNKKKRRSE